MKHKFHNHSFECLALSVAATRSRLLCLCLCRRVWGDRQVARARPRSHPCTGQVPTQISVQDLEYVKSILDECLNCSNIFGRTDNVGAYWYYSPFTFSSTACLIPCFSTRPLQTVLILHVWLHVCICACTYTMSKKRVSKGLLFEKKKLANGWFNVWYKAMTF